MLRNALAWTKPARYRLDTAVFSLGSRTRQLESLKDKFKGRPLLVAGNGPSLNNTPLDDFAHVPSIGMNKIDLIFPRVAWRPDLIVCINNMVVKQHAQTFAKSRIPVLLAYKSRWFAPRSPSINYFNMSLEEDFSTDFATRVGSAATVTYPALQLAYYLGADPVIIIGVDHNFDKTGQMSTYEKRRGDDVNHFDPNYFKAGTYWGLPDLNASERVYLRARHAFEADGRRIVDATVGGKLQIFDKVSMADAKAMAG